MFKMFVI